MSLERYADVVRAFDWEQVHEALGWKPGARVSLGESIIDRHGDSNRLALIAVDKEGGERRLTYRDLAEASNRFANVLRRLGVGQGDRVAGLMPRVPEALIAIISTLKLGAVYVPVFTGFGPDAIRFRLDNSGAKILVTHYDVTNRLPENITARIVCVAEPGTELSPDYFDFHAEARRETADFASVMRNRDDPAAIIYTSGSTGPPKGGTIAVNFLAAVWPYISYGLDLRRDDVFWPTGDPGWGYGFVCYLGALALGGSLITIQQNPTAEQCLSILAEFAVTNLATTPTLLRSLLVLEHATLRAADIRLRALSCCGEPLNAKVVESFQHIWNVTPMDHYGATELALPIGNFNAIPMAVKPGSMGLPFPGFRMAIVADDGGELPAGEIGYIGQKPDSNCRYWTNYWNDLAATADLTRRGWIVTGDLGRRDGDGYFWFEGRADDMIKSAGYRIGPFEVESALLKHPSVAEAAVVGKPDDLRGEIVKAFVVLRPGISGSDGLAEELALFVKTAVGRHQYPRAIEFLDALPKTETGKIQRFALRQRR